MAIVRWDPFAELNALQEQVNTLLSGGFGAPGNDSGLMPATDVYSDDKQLTVEAHLPQFKEDEITVSQHEGTLEIKAEHHEKEEDKEKKYLMRESTSQFYRRIALPRNADEGKVEATFEGGILKVVVPYKELPKPKQIALNAKKK